MIRICLTLAALLLAIAAAPAHADVIDRGSLPKAVSFNDAAATETAAKTFSGGITVTSGITTDTQTTSGLATFNGVMKYAVAGTTSFTGSATTKSLTLPATMPDANYALFLARSDGGAAVSFTTGQQTTTTVNITISANGGTTAVRYVAIAY